MARTVQKIKEELGLAKANEPVLADADSTSKVSISGMFLYIVAFAIHSLEVLFDLHRNDVDTKLLIQKPHTARWYRDKALAFQYGYNLIEDSDKFDNSNTTEQQIKASKIIKYSAVTESEDESRLIIKIATKQGEVLSPVNLSQYEAFKSYIAELKDAGVKVTVINYLPDRLKLNIRIVRDALILDADGMNRKLASYPVNDAINEFLKELPFNGELSVQKLEEKLLAVNGVKDLSVDLAETSWIDPNTNGYGDWQPIDISKIPVSGYFAVNLNNNDNTKSTINYV